MTAAMTAAMTLVTKVGYARTVLSCCLVVLMCGLFGCVFSPEPAPQAPPPLPRVLAGIDDAVVPILLAPGQELEVALPGNPTTGYSWVLLTVPACLATGEAALKAPTADGRVGVGSSSIWHFTATQPGQGLLRFAYQRPWESTAAETVTYKIEVE